MESAFIPETEIFEIRRNDEISQENPKQVEFSNSSMGNYGVMHKDERGDEKHKPERIRLIDLAESPEKLLEAQLKYIDALTRPYIIEVYNQMPIRTARSVGSKLNEGLNTYNNLSFEYAAVVNGEDEIADTILYLSANQSDLPTLRGLVAGYCKFAYPEEANNLLAQLKAVNFDEMVPRDSEMRARKIADLAHAIGQRISPEQLSQNLDTHEYLHAIKATELNVRGRELDEDDTFQAKNLIVMEEALAIMHELRGAVIENKTEVTDPQRLYLQLRLAEVSRLSYGDIFIQRGGVKQTEPELTRYIGRLQDTQQDEQYYYDPHKLAVMLILLGPKVLSEGSNLADLQDGVSINNLIDQVLENPDKFIQSVNGDFYDAFYAKYQLAVQKGTVAAAITKS